MPATPAIAIVVSRYNGSITGALRRGAEAEFRKRTGQKKVAAVIPAPGAFELPALCRAAAESGRFSGVVALGCLIRGETNHDWHIAAAVAGGLVDITIRTGVPIAFGLLTTETAAQAKARAGGEKGNKGAEAMSALLETVATIRALEKDSAREFERTITRISASPRADKARRAKSGAAS
ncbi:MAG: 6,7-dimethyl-8-ribityllumazine synthase [Phycisphaerae bacterium]|nr:6,7-dimethyl-8-ribityllumazine synthase [Phycisphaerae bacterium]